MKENDRHRNPRARSGGEPDRSGESRPSTNPESQPANPDLAAGRSSSPGRPSNPKAADLSVFKEDGSGQVLTTNQGTRVNDNQNTLKAGERGPSLLEDFHFREKMTHFDHERIPERIVHARGSAAHGYFQVYENLSRYTKARFLQDPEVRTPVFVRFSTVAGSRGSTRHGARRTGLCGEVLHRGGDLRPGREQHPRVLHPGCDQVPRPRPRGQARTGQRDAPGRVRARHVLGLHLAHARVHAHGHVGDVRPRAPAQLPDDGGIRGPHVPAGRRRGSVALREVPLEAGAGRPFRRVGRGPEDLGQGSGFPAPRPLGGHRAGPLPGVGAGSPGRRGEARARLRLRPARSHEDHPRGGGPRAARGTPRPQPQSRQLLRGDGAGGVPSRPRRARHRFHRTIPCSRGASSPTRTRSSRGWAGRTSTRSPSTGPSRRCTTISATGTCARPSTAGRSPTSPTPSAEAVRCRPGRIGGGFTTFAERMAGTKIRARSEKFFDHFSQAAHVLPQPVAARAGPSRGGAAVRARQGGAPAHPPAHGRACSSLVDEGLATRVAEGLGFAEIPDLERPLNHSIPGDGPADRFESKPRGRKRRESPALSMVGTPQVGRHATGWPSSRPTAWTCGRSGA